MSNGQDKALRLAGWPFGYCSVAARAASIHSMGMVYTLLRSHCSHMLYLIWQMKAPGDRAAPPAQSQQARVSFSQRAPRCQETESIILVLLKGLYHIMASTPIEFGVQTEPSSGLSLLSCTAKELQSKGSTPFLLRPGEHHELHHGLRGQKHFWR